MAIGRRIGPLIAATGILLFLALSNWNNEEAVAADNSYCGESSEAVSRARALTQSELQAIHKFMFASDQIKSGEIRDLPDAPQALVELQPTSLLQGGPRPSVGLEACSFDYKVAITFNRPSNTEKYVLLRWGGDQDIGFEKLWENASSGE